MAEILVMADSHRADAHIRRLAELFLTGGFAMAIHLGDFAADAKRFEALTGTHVEFFLMSPKLKGWYYHCGVSHGGLSYSALTASGRQQDFTKKLDFKYAITDEADTWTLDVAVPLSGLGGVRAGDCWKVDACVCGRKADGSSAGYDSLCGWGVHLTEYWQVLRFTNLKDK